MKLPILINQIRTPDGTILQSRHRHDYVTYIDANGLEYMVDGGRDYLRRNMHEEAPYEELSIYDTDNWEESWPIVRKHITRGGRGKDGMQPLKYVPLCEMSNAWLTACVEYNTKLAVSASDYEKELSYREKHNINITD